MQVDLAQATTHLQRHRACHVQAPPTQQVAHAQVHLAKVHAQDLLLQLADVQVALQQLADVQAVHVQVTTHSQKSREWDDLEDVQNAEIVQSAPNALHVTQKQLTPKHVLVAHVRAVHAQVVHVQVVHALTQA